MGELDCTEHWCRPPSSEAGWPPCSFQSKARWCPFQNMDIKVQSLLNSTAIWFTYLANSNFLRNLAQTSLEVFCSPLRSCCTCDSSNVSWCLVQCAAWLTGPLCQALGAAKVLQGLVCADGAVWSSASHDYREWSGAPGRSSLLQHSCTVVCLCAQEPERFLTQLPQEQTRARAACVPASSACTSGQGLWLCTCNTNKYLSLWFANCLAFRDWYNFNAKHLARCFMSPGDSLACSNVYLALSH